LIPAAASGSEDVEPETNHRSSPMTARRKTRFVVRRGRTGVPVGEESSNLSGRGANRERVPVPVLQLSVKSCTAHDLDLPVRPMLPRLEDLANQVEILIFFMLVEAWGGSRGFERFRRDLSGRLWIQN
jgi:hypothetical protein